MPIWQCTQVLPLELFMTSNEICSQFAPITWQVDQKCHHILASSFDDLCAILKLQADNMQDDLDVHGSCELVADEHAANNQVNRKIVTMPKYPILTQLLSPILFPPKTPPCNT